jgi:hypothetical protein
VTTDEKLDHLLFNDFALQAQLDSILKRLDKILNGKPNGGDPDKTLQQIIAKENVIISELDLVLEKVDATWDFLHLPQSATLKLTVEGKLAMPATILVGGTANSLFQEWSGPSGTGTVVPDAGAPAFTSSNTAVATVDPVTGISTGVAPGTAVITGTDPTNPTVLTASDTLTVNAPPPPPPVSATLTLTAN